MKLYPICVPGLNLGNCDVMLALKRLLILLLKQHVLMRIADVWNPQPLSIVDLASMPDAELSIRLNSIQWLAVAAPHPKLLLDNSLPLAEVAARNRHRFLRAPG